jgi:hypothetical protein
MPERSDITVDYAQSPRIIKVAAPSTELTIQDLHDTLRGRFEEELTDLDQPELISSAGKEDLGGGVKVGITSTLQNAYVTFEARKASASTGTVTTADTNGITLTDSSATFVTDGLAPGSWLVNLTDGSCATVLTVVSETVLQTDTLGDGTDNQFDFGDSYKIWAVVQCDIDGGNLVAVDAGATVISPILSSAFTQIVRTSSASATQTEESAIRFSSYADSSVWIDTASSTTGTVYPAGTSRDPVNNSADAQAIANAIGVDTIRMTNNLTLDTVTDHTNMLFQGRSPRTTQLTIPVGALVSGAEYRNMLLSGPLTGGTYITSCAVKGIDNVSGHLERCVLREVGAGGYTVRGNGGGIIMINACTSVDAFAVGSGIPTVDANGGTQIAMKNFSGTALITNHTGSQGSEIHINAGRIVLDSTCTGGTIYLYGNGIVVDNSGAGCTVVNDVLDHQNATLGVDAIDSVSLADSAAAEIADKLLGRNIGGGSDGGRTVTSSLRRIRNRNRIVGSTLTVYQEDDSTADHTAVVTTGAGNPITEVDPT